MPLHIRPIQIQTSPGHANPFQGEKMKLEERKKKIQELRDLRLEYNLLEARFELEQLKKQIKKYSKKQKVKR